jgi:hypothetical protein
MSLVSKVTLLLEKVLRVLLLQLAQDLLLRRKLVEPVVSVINRQELRAVREAPMVCRNRRPARPEATPPPELALPQLVPQRPLPVAWPSIHPVRSTAVVL